MKLMFSIILLFVLKSEGQVITNPYFYTTAFTPDTLAKFNFSLSTNTTSGWTNIAGDPNTSVLSATSNGVTVSSIATGDTYWTDNGVAAAGLVTEDTYNGIFPAAAGSGYFFHNSTSMPSGGNIRVSGLVAGATYRIHVWSDRPTATDDRLTRIACIDNSTTEDITNINSAPSSNSSTADREQKTSGGTVYFFKDKIANGSGYIHFQVAAASGWSYGYINALVIIRTL